MADSYPSHVFTQKTIANFQIFRISHICMTRGDIFSYGVFLTLKTALQIPNLSSFCGENYRRILDFRSLTLLHASRPPFLVLSSAPLSWRVAKN